MPLIKIDLVKGRQNEELESILNAIHYAVRSAFKVPEGDRYQIVTQHDSHEMILEDTGLGFKRDILNQIVITVITRPRDEESKKLFYHLVADELSKKIGIDSKNILISMVENTDSDWSFGFGRAQFLTGEL